MDVEVDPKGVDEQRWARLKSVVATMLMEALPEQLINTEVIAKQSFEVPEILFVVMKAYQPGGSSEKAAVLESLRSIEPGVGATEVLGRLREWRRRTVRAKELNLVLPDPSLMVKTLEKAISQIADSQVNLKLNLQRIELELEINPTYASVNAFAKFIEAELQAMSYATTSQTAPATVKALNAPTWTAGAGKGTEKGGEGTRSWKEPCWFFDTKSGCRFGKQCHGFHE